MNVIDHLLKYITPVKALPEGVFHKQALLTDQVPFRLHLRLEKNGSGILIVNASTVLQLNPTAAECAFHFIKGTDPEVAAKEISARYRIRKTEALVDYKDFVEKIYSLIEQKDLDPVTNLGFTQVQPNSTDLSAPLRLDCALTYRLPKDSDPIDAPTKRVDRELNTEEWQTVIDKAWAAGIPQIIFTGGEATLREDLGSLIAQAEKNGQVTGLLTDGRKFEDPGYLESLLNTGLDHVMIILPVNHEPDWESLKNIVHADIFLTVHLTLTPDNFEQATVLLEELKTAGVENISLSLSDIKLKDKLAVLRNRVSELQLHLISDLPVPYSDAHPVAIESAEDVEPLGAGRAWLYIEPDGDVLPAQGFADQILGNILRDEWGKIYQRTI